MGALICLFVAVGALLAVSAGVGLDARDALTIPTAEALRAQQTSESLSSRPRAAPRVIPTAAAPGQDITVSGKVPGKVNRRVFLQRKHRKSWTGVGHAQTTQRGIYTFAATAPKSVGSVAWRVRAPRTVVGKGKRSHTLKAFTSGVTRTNVKASPLPETPPLPPPLAISGTLTQWTTSLADGGVSTVVVLGDSSTEGTGATSYENTITHRLQARLGSLTSANGRLGYVHAASTSESRVPALPHSWSGSPVMGMWGLGGRAIKLSGPDHHVTYAPQQYDRIRVWYGKSDILSHGLRVSVDGEDQGVVLDSNGLGTNSDGHYWESPDLGPGSHTVKITAASEFAGILDGVEFFNSEADASGVRVYNAAHYGYLTSGFSIPHMDMHWQHVAALEPDLTIINLGTNDLYMGVKPARFLADIDAIIERIPAQSSVLLVGGYLRGEFGLSDSKKAEWAQMQAGLLTRATGRVGYLDIAPYWPDLLPDGSTNGGLMLDTVHPNDAGMDEIARLWASVLVPEAVVPTDPASRARHSPDS